MCEMPLGTLAVMLPVAVLRYQGTMSFVNAAEYWGYVQADGHHLRSPPNTAPTRVTSPTAFNHSQAQGCLVVNGLYAFVWGATINPRGLAVARTYALVIS